METCCKEIERYDIKCMICSKHSQLKQTQLEGTADDPSHANIHIKVCQQEDKQVIDISYTHLYNTFVASIHETGGNSSSTTRVVIFQKHVLICTVQLPNHHGYV